MKGAVTGRNNRRNYTSPHRLPTGGEQQCFCEGREIMQFEDELELRKTDIPVSLCRIGGTALRAALCKPWTYGAERSEDDVVRGNCTSSANPEGVARAS